MGLMALEFLIVPLECKGAGNVAPHLPLLGVLCKENKPGGEEESVEQRRNRRVQVQYPISFEGNQGIGNGKLFNLSAQGCGVESGALVQVGTTVTIRVYVPTHKEPIHVGRAGVTWSAGQDFGVEFQDMEPQERERLQNVIDEIQEGKTNMH